MFFFFSFCTFHMFGRGQKQEATRQFQVAAVTPVQEQRCQPRRSVVGLCVTSQRADSNEILCRKDVILFWRVSELKQCINLWSCVSIWSCSLRQGAGRVAESVSCGCCEGLKYYLAELLLKECGATTWSGSGVWCDFCNNRALKSDRMSFPCGSARMNSSCVVHALRVRASCVCA